MGSCSSRDLDNEEIRDFKSGKNIATYGKKNFNRTLRYNDSDIILFAFHGDVLSIKTAMLRKEMPDVLSIRGFSQTIFLNDGKP